MRTLPGVFRYNRMSGLQTSTGIGRAVVWGGTPTGSTGHRFSLEPDLLVNAGGVVVSHLVWVQDMRHYLRDLDGVNPQMESIKMRSLAQGTEIARKEGVSMWDAVMLLAVGLVVEAMLVRGVCP